MVTTRCPTRPRSSTRAWRGGRGRDPGDRDGGGQPQAGGEQRRAGQARPRRRGSSRPARSRCRRARTRRRRGRARARCRPGDQRGDHGRHQPRVVQVRHGQRERLQREAEERLAGPLGDQRDRGDQRRDQPGGHRDPSAASPAAQVARMAATTGERRRSAPDRDRRAARRPAPRGSQSATAAGNATHGHTRRTAGGRTDQPQRQRRRAPAWRARRRGSATRSRHSFEHVQVPPVETVDGRDVPSATSPLGWPA